MVALAVASVGHLASVTSTLIRQAGEMACAWDGGEDMDSLIDTWSDGGRNVKAMQDASATLLKNPATTLNSQPLNRASQLMDAVNTSKPIDTLYRGMGISNAEATKLLGQGGKNVSLPLTSATHSRDVATTFSQRVRGLPATTDMHLVTEIRGARGFSISDMVPYQYADQAEVIIMGNFRVVEVTQDGNQMRMILEAF